MARGSPTMSAMLCFGSSDEYGSWKTICIDSRCRRSVGPRSEVTSLPSTTTVPAGRVDEAEHQPGQGGLARAALAHQTQGRPGVDAQADLVDRSHRPGHPPQHPAAQREILDQVAHLEHRGTVSIAGAVSLARARCRCARRVRSAVRTRSAHPGGHSEPGSTAARLRPAASAVVPPGRRSRMGTGASVHAPARRSSVARSDSRSGIGQDAAPCRGWRAAAHPSGVSCGIEWSSASV